MHAGGMLMMACIVTAAALAYEIKNNISDRAGIILLAAAFIIITGGLMFTYTRGSWLAALLGVLMIAGYTDRRMLVAVLAAVLLAAFLFRGTSIVKRAEGVVKAGENNSASERILMWKSGLMMIKDRPLTGIGTANLDRIYPKYRQPGTFESNQGHLHNNIIQLAVIDGIPGMLAYLWIFTAMWVSMLRGMAAPGKEYLKIIFFACFSASVGFFINGFFEYNFVQAQTALIFWFLTGMGYAIIRGNREPVVGNSKAKNVNRKHVKSKR
jgi:O-antigen ligase